MPWVVRRGVKGWVESVVAVVMVVGGWRSVVTEGDGEEHEEWEDIGKERGVKMFLKCIISHWSH